MSVFIGIDISAKIFDVVTRNQGKPNKPNSFEQSFEGHEKCIKQLKKLKPKLIVMEATGIYHLDLAIAIYDAGLPISVINPASFKQFAALMLTQSKTDGIDAGLLAEFAEFAEFAERMEPRLWVVPTKNCIYLKDLGRQIQRLKRDSTKTKNRLHAFKSKQSITPLLIEDVEDGIAPYTLRIGKLTKAALALIHDDQNLNTHFNNMQAAKGIGQASAISILAEFVALSIDMKAKQVSRHAGLDVKLRQSGSSVNGASRISKAGNAYLRSALFMPAMSAVRHDENAKAFKEALVGRGKKKIQANVAVMRKYLTGLWAVYQTGVAFDSSKLFSDIHKKACS
jgi:transposase